MNILVTGASGFIGKSLVLRLKEFKHLNVEIYLRNDTLDKLKKLIKNTDIVIHLAGENRPPKEEYFEIGNSLLTQQICDFIQKQKKNIPIIMTSSIHAELNNPYGRSKLSAEESVEKLNISKNNSAVIYRLPGVFGKWCKPNYNSVVATFCYNTINGLPLKIDDPSSNLKLVYVDDVIDSILDIINKPF